VPLVNLAFRVVLVCAVLALGGGGLIPTARAEPSGKDLPLQRFKLADPSASATLGLGVYRPSFPNDLGAVEEYEQAAGAGLPLIHWYALWNGWKSSFSRSDLEAVDRRGSVPLISWEPWAGRPDDPDWSLREAILSGRHDDYIQSWASGMAEYGKPVLLRFAHEMHHQSYPWALGVNGNTAEDYVATWRYVRTAFDRAGATNVKWVWNPNTLGNAPAEAYEPLYRALYPGDTYVDWIGLDIYNGGPGLDWGSPTWRSFGDILAAPYQAITALTDKPLLLPEVGCAELGGSKAAWIRDALTTELPQRFPRVRALVWFDNDKAAPWALHSSKPALEAWTVAVNQSLSER